MITPYSNSQFLSRIFTDAVGRQFRLTFLVAVVNGELKGRLVSAQPVSANTNNQTPITNLQLTGSVCDSSNAFCLPIVFSNKKPATVYAPYFAPVVSPYFSLEFLINSQPTRAPSRR
ncbi:MAG: hypothetical protein WCS89_01495 [Candidatus Paceibacterota bacterium]|jgi:hypothetical protein